MNVILLKRIAIDFIGFLSFLDLVGGDCLSYSLFGLCVLACVNLCS